MPPIPMGPRRAARVTSNPHNPCGTSPIPVDAWAVGGAQAKDPHRHSGDANIVASFWSRLKSDLPPGDFQLLRDSCTIGEVVVDCACTIMLVQRDSRKYLTNIGPSSVTVTGYKGAAIQRAECQGTMHIWSVATHGERPDGYSGASAVKEAHVMEDLNSQLYSCNIVINDHKMQLIIMHPDEGVSALARHDATGGVWMALRYSVLTRHWYQRVVQGVSASLCERVGRMYELFYENNGGVARQRGAGALSVECMRRLQRSALAPAINTRSGVATNGGHAACPVLDVRSASSRVVRGTPPGGSDAAAGVRPRGTDGDHAERAGKRARQQERDRARGIDRRQHSPPPGPGGSPDRSPSYDEKQRAWDASLESARGLPTAELVRIVVELRTRFAAYYSIDSVTPAPSSLGPVFGHHAIEALWGDLCGEIYDYQNHLPSTLIVDDGSYTLRRLPPDELLFLQDSGAAAGARRVLTEHRVEYDNELGVFLALRLWPQLRYKEPAAYCTTAGGVATLGASSRYPVRDAGRLHVLDLMTVGWRIDDEGDALLSHFVAGPAVNSTRWTMDMMADSSVVAAVAQGDPRVRAVLRLWTAADRHDRLHVVRAGLERLATHATMFRGAVALLSSPGGSKRRYMQMRQEEDSQPGRRAGPCFTYRAHRPAGTDLRQPLEGHVQSLLRGYEAPPEGELTMCTSPWTVVVHVTAQYLSGTLDRAVFERLLALVVSESWLTPVVVVLVSDARGVESYIKRRNAAGDRHLTGPAIAHSMAALLLVADALGANQHVRVQPAVGNVTAAEVGLLYRRVDAAGARVLAEARAAPRQRDGVDSASVVSARAVPSTGARAAGGAGRQATATIAGRGPLLRHAAGEPEAETALPGTPHGLGRAAVSWGGLPEREACENPGVAAVGHKRNFGRRVAFEASENEARRGEHWRQSVRAGLPVQLIPHTNATRDPRGRRSYALPAALSRPAIMKGPRLPLVSALAHSRCTMPCEPPAWAAGMATESASATSVTILPKFVGRVADLAAQYGGTVSVRTGADQYRDYVPAAGTVAAEAYDVDEPEPEEPEGTEPEPVDGAGEPRHAHPSAPEPSGLDSDLALGNAHHGGDPLARMYYSLETDERAVKAGLKGRKAKMSALEFHCTHNHFPWRGDCELCVASMAVFKRTTKRLDPFMETRANHTFHADGLTLDVRSRDGKKYVWVLRDAGSKFFDALTLRTRDELPQLFKQWLIKMRADSRFNWMEDYAFCSEIKLDCAREQGPDSSKWSLALDYFDPRPHCTWTDPQSNGQANGLAEVTVRQLEISLRTMLRQRSLPAFMWSDCLRQLIGVHGIRNWLPTREALEHGRGDAASPLEKATNGRIDRRTINYWVKVFEAVGTLCIVLCRYKEIGSHISEDRWRMGIIIGVLGGDLMEFYDPQGSMNVKFRSQHYMVIKVPLGVPVDEFLGLSPRVAGKLSAPLGGDYVENQSQYIVVLDDVRQWAEKHGLPDTAPALRGEQIVRTRGCSRPGLLVVDKNFQHWEATFENGVAGWRPAGPLMQRLREMGALEPNLPHARLAGPPPPPPPRAPEPAALEPAAPEPAAPAPTALPAPAPEPDLALGPSPLYSQSETQAVHRRAKSFVGKCFYKRFGPELLCYGRVSGYIKSRGGLWKICYDVTASDAAPPDNDSEEFDAVDILRYLVHAVDQPDGGATGAPPEPSALDAPSPYAAQPGNSAPVWTRALLGAHPAIIVTHQGWTFKQVCGECGIDETEFKLYYKWLGASFGEKALNLAEHPARLGFYFSNPFTKRGSNPWKRTLEALPVGSTFPMPRGERWEADQRQLHERSEHEEQANLVEELLQEGKGMCEDWARAQQELAAGATASDEFAARLATAQCHGALHVQELLDAAAGEWDVADDGGDWLLREYAEGSARAKRAAEDHARGRSVSRAEHEQLLVETACYCQADSDDERALLRYVEHFNNSLDWKTAAATFDTTEPAATAETAHEAYKTRAGPAASSEFEAGPVSKLKLRGVRTDWPDWDLSAYMKDGKLQAPKTIAEARTRVDWPRWEDAIAVEYESLESLKVFLHNITKREAREKYNVTSSAIPLRCILKVAYAPDNKTILKYKARRIAVGHSAYAKQGIHYGDTWSATPEFSVIRLIEGLAARRGYAELAFDVCVAFVQGELDPKDYLLVEYEKEYACTNSNGEKCYALLLRPLYGVASAPRAFSAARDKWLMETFNANGWTVRVSIFAPCLYIFTAPSGNPYFMTSHVDDNYVCGPEMEEAKVIRDAANRRFVVKDVDPKQLLGVQRKKHADGSLEYLMTGFIQHLRERFKEHCSDKQRDVPFPFNEMLERGTDPDEGAAVEALGLRSLVGGLMWAYRMAMPLLGPGLNQVCKVVSSPTRRSWDCAIHLLEWAYQERDRGIRLAAPNALDELHCFYDAGGVRDPQDSKCQYGWVVMVWGGPVDWATKKQKHVSHAGTMGLEFMSKSHAVKATAHMRMLMIDIGILERDAPPNMVIGDNKNAVIYATELKLTPNMKHLRECYFLSREWHQSGEMTYWWVNGTDNPADPMSKPVSKEVIAAQADRVLGYTDERYELPAHAHQGKGLGVKYPVDREAMARHAAELG